MERLPFLQGLVSGRKNSLSPPWNWDGKVTTFPSPNPLLGIRGQSGTDFLTRRLLASSGHPDFWSPHLEYGEQRLLLHFINEEFEIKTCW